MGNNTLPQKQGQLINCTLYTTASGLYHHKEIMLFHSRTLPWITGTYQNKNFQLKRNKA